MSTIRYFVQWEGNNGECKEEFKNIETARMMLSILHNRNAKLLIEQSMKIEDDLLIQADLKVLYWVLDRVAEKVKEDKEFIQVLLKTRAICGNPQNKNQRYGYLPRYH